MGRSPSAAEPRHDGPGIQAGRTLRSARDRRARAAPGRCRSGQVGRRAGRCSGRRGGGSVGSRVAPSTNSIIRKWAPSASPKEWRVTMRGWIGAPAAGRRRSPPPSRASRARACSGGRPRCSTAEPSRDYRAPREPCSDGGEARGEAARAGATRAAFSQPLGTAKRNRGRPTRRLRRPTRVWSPAWTPHGPRLR